MRKFKCIGLREGVITYWNHKFEIGSVYLEEDDIHTEIGELYLISDGNNGSWVDADQFEEVKEDESC